MYPKTKPYTLQGPVSIPVSGSTRYLDSSDDPFETVARLEERLVRSGRRETEDGWPGRLFLVRYFRFYIRDQLKG